jgi:hypothetical protein
MRRQRTVSTKPQEAKARERKLVGGPVSAAALYCVNRASSPATLSDAVMRVPTQRKQTHNALGDATSDEGRGVTGLSGQQQIEVILLVDLVRRASQIVQQLLHCKWTKPGKPSVVVAARTRAISGTARTARKASQHAWIALHTAITPQTHGHQNEVAGKVQERAADRENEPE